MKITLFSLILLTFTSLKGIAQNCPTSCPYYKDFVKKAEADTVKNTQAKLNYYRAAIVAARDCNCPALEELAYSKIDTLFILIEAEKRKAELQAKTISEQQSKIEKTLAETEAANKTNIKIIKAMDFYGGNFALASKNGKYGFIDKDGNTKIDFDYDKGRPFSLEDGFARMEIIDEFSNKGIEYLVDTTGNRYQLFNITEEYVVLLKKKLAEHNLKSKLEGEEHIKSINELFVHELNKTEEKIALNFLHAKNSNVLNLLQCLAKNSKIRDRVEILMLSERKLSKFPNSIMEFKKLKYLDIGNTGMKSIPKTIDELIELKRLTFPIYLKKLPSSVYNLEHLEVLDLFATDLSMTELPIKIDQLINLKELYVPESLEKLPSSIYNLKNLEVLDLFGKELSITNFPTTIERLINLKELHVPESLETLPESIGNLKKLEVLDLSQTNVKDIPESIGKLKNLKSLTFSRNIKKIPSSIYYLENLENLDLYGTDEKELPEAIGNLKKLKNLEIQIPFENVPSGICRLENLEYLLLESEKEIINFPDSIENLKKLKELYLFFPLKVLPKNICKLESLEILHLFPLLESFPNDFGNLTNLKMLVIEDNSNLKSIPDISKMKKLKNFYFTLYKDQNYAANLEKLKELQKKLPDCEFDISDENGNTINVKGN